MVIASPELPTPPRQFLGLDRIFSCFGILTTIFLVVVIFQAISLSLSVYLSSFAVY